MKAWRLAYNRMALEIIDIDDVTREVKKIVKLQLKTPMTPLDAQQYVDSHYPQSEAAR